MQCARHKQEKDGSSSFVAEDKHKDTQLKFALDLLRGTKSVTAGEIKKTNQICSAGSPWGGGTVPLKTGLLPTPMCFTIAMVWTIVMSNGRTRSAGKSAEVLRGADLGFPGSVIIH